MNKFTTEMKDYVKNNHKGKSTIELSKEINDLFGLTTKPDDIQNLKTRIKRKEGFKFAPARNDGRIKKGNIPANKGKKWDEYMSKESQIKAMKTLFKKGNISPNSVPVGTERKTKGGYIKIKVKDGELNKNWKFKHRYIYEQHYGSIPENCKIIFLDGNKYNFDINNLKMVSKAEELIMNKKKLRFNDKKLTESGHLISKIILKRSALKNERL